MEFNKRTINRDTGQLNPQVDGAPNQAHDRRSGGRTHKGRGAIVMTDSSLPRVSTLLRQMSTRG